MCLIKTIKQIEQAFAHVPPAPQWKGIYTAEAWDDYRDPTPEEKAKDIRLTWQQVIWEDVTRCTTALSHLSPEGWHHFLPAFMCLTLQNKNNPESLGHNVMDSAAFSLRKPNEYAKKHNLVDYLEQRHSRLNLPQIEAVIAYFQCFYEQQADFYFDDLYNNLHYWHERYKAKGGKASVEELLWLFYGA